MLHSISFRQGIPLACNHVECISRTKILEGLVGPDVQITFPSRGNPLWILVWRKIFVIWRFPEKTSWKKMKSEKKTPWKKKCLEKKWNPEGKNVLKYYVTPMSVPSLRNIQCVYCHYLKSQVCAVVRSHPLVPPSSLCHVCAVFSYKQGSSWCSEV